MWALGLFEIIFFAVFFVLLAVGVTFDRRGQEEPKWYIFGIGLVIIVAWFWKDWTFAAAWDTVRSWSFWEPVVAYMLAGLVYSIIEFVLDVRRSARRYKELWDRSLSARLEVKQLDDKGEARMVENAGGRRTWVVENTTAREVLANQHIPSNAAAAKEFVESFVTSNTGDSRKSHGFVRIVANGMTPEPKIDKAQLAEHIGAWTFFWPAYAVSLVLGDLLTEIFTWLTDALVKLSGRFVRMSFSDVFKF